MVKISPQEEETPTSQLAPPIFREIMSDAAGLLARHIRKGGVASFSAITSFSGNKRTWTSAYRLI